jgi:hypothetical protein
MLFPTIEPKYGCDVLAWRQCDGVAVPADALAVIYLPKRTLHPKALRLYPRAGSGEAPVWSYRLPGSAANSLLVVNDPCDGVPNQEVMDEVL